MNTYKIAAILIDNGFNVKMKKVNKNGEELDALIVGTDPIAACFYERDFNGTEESVAEMIMNTLSTVNTPKVDMELLMDWGKAKDIVLAGVRINTNDTHNVTKTFQDLEVYFYIPVDSGIVKVNNDMLTIYGITKDELFDVAVKNTAKETKVKSMFDMMNELGAELDDEYYMPSPLVLTNRNIMFGAAAILCNSVLDKVCHILHTNMIWIIPSSIHELMVKEVNSFDERDNLMEMITSVNETLVSPNERLADHPYLYVKGHGIEIK